MMIHNTCFLIYVNIMVVYVASGHVLHFDTAHGRARSHGRHRRVMPGSVATIFSVGRLRQGDVQDPFRSAKRIHGKEPAMMIHTLQ